MGSLIGALVARGWSEKAARALSYAGLALLLAGALWGLVAAYNAHVIGGYKEKQQQRAAPATNKAAAQREVDAATRAEKSKEMTNVIHSVPDQAINPVSHARGCEQLRRAGRHSPACSGSSPAR